MAESLNLEVQREDGIGILTIVGYINNTGGEKIADSCNEMIEEGVIRFVLDLEGCRIVNSVGISILIELIEKLKTLDGRLAFCRVTPTIAKTFRIMGLLQSCSVHDDRPQAMAAVQA